jgi:transglutaminase-like putative cysteine protease
MRRKYAATFFLVACCVASVPVVAQSQTPKPLRRFEFTHDVTVNNLPSTAQNVRIWIPLASSNKQQTVRVLKLTSSVPARITRDRSFGNRILYAEIHHPRSRSARFKVVYSVVRYEYSRGSYDTLRSEQKNPDLVPVSLVRFLQPDRMVQTGGIIAQISEETTRNEKNPLDKAYALYNYVFRNMRYDKSGTGWGRGDALWACDAKHGNCTDFHSLFIALARAARIPARFDIGFPLPPDAKAGSIPGYHCWAEFYLEDSGWVPVDISEAWLHPSEHNFFFGSLDANRVQFSTGRDLVLAPRQSGPPVNYFVYPYVEVDGKPFTSISKRFSFRNLPTVK